MLAPRHVLMAGLLTALAGSAGAVPRTFNPAGVTTAPMAPYLQYLSIAPDGAHLYAADVSQISIFARDGGSGALTYVGVEPNAGPPTVSPDGAHVYTMEGFDIGVYSRNVGTGALTLVEQETSTLGFYGQLVLSPDGANVYVTAANDNAIAVFSRNAGTGELTFVEAENAPGLNYPQTLAVSPDGAHVYAANFSDTVLVFSRASGTGALTLASTVTGVGFISIGGMAVSPDGTRLYGSAAHSSNHGTLAVFARDTVTGALTLLEIERGDEAGVPPIGGPVAVSPDGELVVSTDGNSTALFARQPTTGGISFIEASSGFAGFPAAFSPDGAHIYRSGSSGGVGAVQHLTAGFAGCESGPLTGCRAPGAGTMRIHETRGIVWRWTRGADTSLQSLGDPTTTTDYALCVYDESGPTPALAMRALVPAGGDCVAGVATCWSPATGGFRYRDPHRTPEGLFDLTLKSGGPGTARVTTRGTGTNLALPAMPLGLPVRVQLQSSLGECWEATYSAARANDSSHFVARPD
jgi:DNA-binding beta-propeller fold protein YncE